MVCASAHPRRNEPARRRAAAVPAAAQRAPALRHTSTGEALRDAIKANSAAGRKARAERESAAQVRAGPARGRPSLPRVPK